jgi:processive 1,2-diacylglycerol beta-glucosyltransferase
VLVSGGGWGVGDVRGAVPAALAVPDAIVVCACGHNERLRARLEATYDRESRVRVLGFTDEMPDLITAADVLVDSTVGVTCLEALTRGRPIVVYGPPPGHSRDNARMMQALELGQAARSPDELSAALSAALADGNGAAIAPAPSAARAILAASPRSPSRSTRRSALRRPASA